MILNRFFLIVLPILFCSLLAEAQPAEQETTEQLSASAENLEKNELPTTHYKVGRDTVIAPTLPSELEALLRSLFNQYDGVDPILWDEVIQIFSSHSDFDGAEIYEFQDSYFLEPLQYPRLTDVTFSGLKSIGENEALRILNLTMNEQILDEEFEEGKIRLEEIYHSLGFYQFKLLAKKSLIGKQMTYEINISEGLQIRMGEINFQSDNPEVVLLLNQKLKGYKNRKINDSIIEDFIKEVRTH